MRKKVNLTKLWWRKDYAGIIKILKHPKSFQFDVNIKDSLGYTPLMLAVSDNKVRIVKLLLRHPKINVNAANKTGWSALTLATWHHNQRIIKLLLAHPRIDVHIRTALSRSSPLALSVSSNSPWKASKTIKKLLNHPKFDFSREDIQKTAFGALHTALSTEDWRSLKLLLKQPGFEPLPAPFLHLVATLATHSLHWRVLILARRYRYKYKA